MGNLSSLVAILTTYLLLKLCAILSKRSRLKNLDFSSRFGTSIWNLNSKCRHKISSTNVGLEQEQTGNTKLRLTLSVTPPYWNQVSSSEASEPVPGNLEKIKVCRLWVELWMDNEVTFFHYNSAPEECHLYRKAFKFWENLGSTLVQVNTTNRDYL